jgi:hypothetical protein
MAILKLELKLDPCPKRGEGLNTWMFKTAAHLARHGVSMDGATAFIASQAGDSARPGEVTRQVEQGFAAASGNAPVRTEGGRFKVPARPTQKKWPELDSDQITQAVKAAPATIEDIMLESPLPPDATRHPIDVLAELHGAKGEEFLCIAPRPTNGFCTRTFNEWAESVRRRWKAGKHSIIQDWQMVVPNLMQTRAGTTKEGRDDRPRTSANACHPDQMRFAVVEVDITHDDPICGSLGKTPPEICASIILGKLDRDKLRMVVRSGGKSLHAWMDVHGMNAEELESLFRSLAPLGVDPRDRLPEQQFRLPNGYRREKQARQSVIYWNPQP